MKWRDRETVWWLLQGYTYSQAQAKVRATLKARAKRWKKLK